MHFICQECALVFAPRTQDLHSINYSYSTFITTCWIFNLPLWPRAKQDTSRANESESCFDDSVSTCQWGLHIIPLRLPLYITLHVPSVYNLVCDLRGREYNVIQIKALHCILIPSPRVSTSLEANMLGQVVRWTAGCPSLADPNAAGRSGSPALTAVHCKTEKQVNAGRVNSNWSVTRSWT